jgi:glutamate-1-semialdehyde 2,1-aminomutase
MKRGGGFIPVKEEKVVYKEKLHSLIPGGAHTYSRGDDQYPENAHFTLSHGEGCYVWDTDGNKYLDYGMGLRSVTIGYAYPDIVEAALAEIKKGNTLARATHTELKAAELITDLIPCADMVKFSKNGSTVTTAAVKLARVYTGRKYVAICADHPFFSYDDWFISSTVVDKGIPEEYKKLTLKFNYNDVVSLERLFEAYPNQIAAVILEPVASSPPENNFLFLIRDLCSKNHTVLIFDEMITGFRWHIQGAQKYFEVNPDIATFGKGMANGFSVAALVGRREILDLGGILNEGEERVFLISTTHGAEMCGLGAFIKTVEVYKDLGVIKHLWDYGEKLMGGMNVIARELGINDFFYLEGYPCSPTFITKDKNGQNSMELRTIFTYEMASNNILFPWIALCYSHKERELEMTLEAARKALKVYCQALNSDVNTYIKGSVLKPVFRRFN